LEAAIYSLVKDQEQIMSEETQLQKPADVRSDYVTPAILHELALETRAGSPLGGDPLVDPLGLDPTTLE
jgi:hypothetical protein